MSNGNNNINQTPFDLNQAYGINSICRGNECTPSNTIAPGYTIPSIEQIAGYRGGEELYPVRTDIQAQFPTTPSGNIINQMYRPISQQDAIDYPTPAIMMAEARGQQDTGQTQILLGNPGNVITDYYNPYPVTRENLQYLNGFIRTQIGRRVTIDFLIGSNNMVSKSGYLLAVAANYILINELDTTDVTACDFYNIKFIRFYY